MDASIPNPTSARWFNTCTINLAGQRQNCASAGEQSAWILQPAFTLRTLNSYFPNIRQSDPPNADVSLFKQFILYERMRLQFRAEAFNFTNTARFGSPNITPTSNAFGVVSFSPTNDPRNVQLGLKLLW